MSPYAPASGGGLGLLAHELTHVAQHAAAGPAPAVIHREVDASATW